MAQEHFALLLDEALLTLDDLASSCAVSREWVIEHVQAGVLLTGSGADPGDWAFTGRDLLRIGRISGLERDFDANPELAGLLADLFDELERLRIRLRRAGLSTD
jgi:chaperone modulatory protein CbpM